MSAELPTSKFSTSSTESLSLKSQISELTRRKAARKLHNLIIDTENDDNAPNRPDGNEYSSAIRSQLQLKRPDLALDLYRIRRRAQESRPHSLASDIPLTTTMLRMTLRDDLKRKERTSAFEDIFDDLKADCAGVVKEPEDHHQRMRKIITVLLSTLQTFLEKGQTQLASELVEVTRGVASCGERAAVDPRVFNTTIRLLGKNKLLNNVFDILDMMRMTRVQPDNETFEFLANAAVRQVRFVMGAVSMETLPEPLGAEIAFVGRSNVGKSSLVNMICNRKALAYVSGRPGKTQQFNYFLVNEKTPESQFYIVDLPGVGYAKVPIPVKEEWLRFMRRYLKSRVSLRLVLHLVDGRHGALKDDEELMSEIAVHGKQLEYVVVLTKMDKMDKQKAKRGVIDSIQQALVRNGCAEDTPIVLTSASTRLGRDEMWRHMQNALKSLGGTQHRHKRH
ncbi:50S ribosome-binding GTPase [Gracilaria domingensis]|nr:50S ribosome-binding GTPase [Gracilaria domingensis]